MKAPPRILEQFRELEDSGTHAEGGMFRAFQAGSEDLPSLERLDAIATSLGDILGPHDGGSDGGGSDGGGSDGGGSDGGGEPSPMDVGRAGDIGSSGALDAALGASQASLKTSTALGAKAGVSGAVALGSSSWGAIGAAVLGGATAVATGLVAFPDSPDQLQTRTSDTAIIIPPSLAETSSPPLAPPPPVDRESVAEQPKLAPIDIAAPATSGSERAPVLSEADLLTSARIAMNSNPNLAWELLDEHAKLYPNGVLTQERELLRIETLIAQGQHSAALARARSLLDVNPDSAHRRRLEVLLPELLKKK